MSEQISVPSILCLTCWFNRGEVKALHSTKARGETNKVCIWVLFDCKKYLTLVSGKEEYGSYKFVSIAGRKTQVNQTGISKPGRPRGQ